MTLFNKNCITNESYSWFKDKLENSFQILDNQRSKVIFGFNGIGKTTLFKCLKEMNNEAMEYLEYGELKDILVKQRDKLIISSNVNQIETLQNQISTLKSAVDHKKNLKDNFGISNRQRASSFGTRIQAAQQNGTFTGFISQKNAIETIESYLQGVPSRVFIDIFPELATIRTAEQELENQNKKLLLHALATLDEITKETDTICPVCGNSAHNLKEIIEEKRRQLSGTRSELTDKLRKANINVDADIINDLVTAHALLVDDEDLKSDYLICNGNSNNYDAIQQNYAEFLALEAQLQPLMTQARANYNSIRAVKSSLEHDLEKYFGIQQTNIEYDDDKFTITIKFPRELKTYSTGEFNLIGFLYKIYSFIGSDKSTLVLDDPVSSLDLLNHYKIAYEIVRHSTSKTIIVLTHSIEFINVVNSQYPGKFDFLYLEEFGQSIRIQPIVLNGEDPNPNVITLDKLSDTQDFLGFIEALKRRETEVDNDEIQELFHYTPNEKFLDGNQDNFSNHSLINLIDEFTSFRFYDFYGNSYVKVQHLSALRVWLEKALFDLIPEENDNLRNNFLQKETLSKKINCILPRNATPTIAVPRNLNRDVLVSKKVMLNQGVHYYSQIMPFSYAINLSLDMLEQEIIELKDLFS